MSENSQMRGENNNNNNRTRWRKAEGIINDDTIQKARFPTRAFIPRKISNGVSHCIGNENLKSVKAHSFNVWEIPETAMSD